MNNRNILAVLCICLCFGSVAWSKERSEKQYVHVRQCEGLLAQVLTAFETPQIFEVALDGAAHLPVLDLKLPTRGRRKLYFQLSGSSIDYFSTAYAETQPVPYASGEQFFASMKKNRVFNFVWLKSGILRISEEGRTLFRVLAAKHIVLSSHKNPYKLENKKDALEIVAAGEMGVEADGTLFLNDATGTFHNEQNLKAIEMLAKELQDNFSLKTRLIPWNYVASLRERIHAGTQNPPVTTGAVVDVDGEIGLLRDIRMYWQRYVTRREGSNHYINRREQRPDNLRWGSYKIEKVPLSEMARINQDILGVIKNHPELTPSVGPEPSWSYPAYALMKQKARGVVLSKLTAALILARAREYVSTGLENALENQVAQYRGPPIWPAQLFEMCYVLAQGDMFKALLTCHNVLATNSRLVNRQETGIHPKLAYIRNDSLPYGDNFGAWYHFFGIAGFSLKRNCSFSKLTGYVESLGSRLVGAPDYQEELMNKLGVKLGQELKELVRPQIPSQQEVCDYVAPMIF